MSELSGVLDVAANNETAVFELSAETQSLLQYALDQVANYKRWVRSPIDELTDSDKAAIDDLIDNATYEIMNMLTLPYPEQFEISTLTATADHGGAIVRTISSGQLFNGGIENTPIAINNVVGFSFYGRKGTYTLSVLGITGTNYGIVTAQVSGGALTPSQDWYSAAGVANVIKTYVVDVPDDGLNIIQFVVASKRAASTSYRFIFSQLLMQRTGD